LNETRNLRVALLGCGSVGAQVARVLLEDRDELTARVGAKLTLTGIAVRDINAKRDVDLPRELFTTDPQELLQDADIIVELMGGIEPARALLLQALEQGTDVVTANKALVAAHGPELFAAAECAGAQLSYEAAVAGAIPIIRPLQDSLAGDRINRVMGIVNGSTNYILDRMDRFDDTAEDAMRVASELGFLEADPTLDVEGYDAAQKAGILARIAYHTEVPQDAVYREGISGITAEQVKTAQRSGAVIKLLAIAERVPDKNGNIGVSARVYPALVHKDHPLAAVRESMNALFVEAEYAGELMFYGAGAGGVETASAVMGDVVSVARRHVVGGPGIANSSHAALPVLSIDDTITRYQVLFTVEDRAGVLQEVSRLFGEDNVSIARMEQSLRQNDDGTATLVIETHHARESALSAVVERVRQSDVVREVQSVLRVEGGQ
jgi:homoserine dehydrogenase